MSGPYDINSQRRSPIDADGDGLANPKTRDADGCQLVQSTAATSPEPPAWNRIGFEAAADLDLKSTERRRASRARTLRKR